MYSDVDIRRAIKSGRMQVEPFEGSLVQPASLDMRLDKQFKVMQPHNVPFIDPAKDQSFDLYENVTANVIFIQPGQFALATTVEFLRLDRNMFARIEGKSSLGRLGLLVHSTAGFIDPGFAGKVTLEIGNISPLPIKLYYGMPICQLACGSLTSATAHGYEGKYQNQDGPQGSKYHLNFEEGGPMYGWTEEP